MTLNAIGLLCFFNIIAYFTLFEKQNSIFFDIFNNNQNMVLIFVRSTIIYLACLLIIRLMGKRQIGEMQPFEFVVTLIIAELACIPMSDVSIPLLYGVSAIIAVFIIHQIMALLSAYKPIFKTMLSGKPSVVINKDGIDFKELQKNNLDVDDLIESLRGLGYFSLDSVVYAIYESNGNLSAVENPNKQNSSSLPILIFKDGKINEQNVKLADIQQQDFDEIFKTCNVKNTKKVKVVTIDGDGNFYLQENGKKYITGKYKLIKGAKW